MLSKVRSTFPRLLVILFLIIGSFPLTYNVKAVSIQKELIFSDNFDDGSIDSSKWIVSGTISEQNGYLVIGSGSTLRSKSTFGVDINLEFSMKTPNDVNIENRLHQAGLSDASDVNNIIFFDWQSPDTRTISIGSKLNDYWSDPGYQQGSDITSWQNYKIARGNSIADYYQNNNLLNHKTNYIPNNNLNIIFDSGIDYTFYIDNISVYRITYVTPRVPRVFIDEFSVTEDRCDIGSIQNIKIHARWDNSSNVFNGLITVAESTLGIPSYTGAIQVKVNSYPINSEGWITLSSTSSTVTKKAWAINAVDCSGVTLFTQTASSPSIIWDRVNLKMKRENTRIDAGTPLDESWTSTYEYDGSPFNGKTNYYGIVTATDSAEVNKITYRVNSIDDEKYGLTVFTFKGAECIWDRVKITQGGVSNPLTKTGSMENVWFKAVYEYDGEEFTGEPIGNGGMNKMSVNGIPLVWSSFDKVWKYSTKLDDNGKLVFEVSGVEDIKYKLTKFVDAVGPQSITWEKPFLETPVGIACIIAAIIIMTMGAIYYLRKKSPFLNPSENQSSLITKKSVSEIDPIKLETKSSDTWGKNVKIITIIGLSIIIIVFGIMFIIGSPQSQSNSNEKWIRLKGYNSNGWRDSGSLNGNFVVSNSTLNWKIVISWDSADSLSACNIFWSSDTEKVIHITNLRGNTNLPTKGEKIYINTIKGNIHIWGEYKRMSMILEVYANTP